MYNGSGYYQNSYGDKVYPYARGITRVNLFVYSLLTFILLGMVVAVMGASGMLPAYLLLLASFIDSFLTFVLTFLSFIEPLTYHALRRWLMSEKKTPTILASLATVTVLSVSVLFFNGIANSITLSLNYSSSLSSSSSEVVQTTKQDDYPQPGKNYTVQPGDTLSTIAQQVYGDSSEASVDKIYNTNKQVIGDDRDKIYPGQVLYIPT